MSYFVRGKESVKTFHLRAAQSSNQYFRDILGLPPCSVSRPSKVMRDSR